MPKQFKKVDIRKQRKKAIQEQQKQLKKEDPEKFKKLKEKDETLHKSEEEIKLDERLNKETKLYWTRAFMGFLCGIIGRLLLNFVGWSLFFWMIGFWFGFPFIASFLIFRFKYDKEEWNWKNIMKPGLLIYFLLFMFITTFIHTLLRF